MELRQEVLASKAAGEEAHLLRVEQPQVPDFLLLGQAVSVVDAIAG
jgi:hypothetical protein